MSPRAGVPMLSQLVDVLLWGRVGGTWWALVSWTLYGNTVNGNRWVHVSGWVRGADVVPSADPSQRALYRALERVDLPADLNTVAHTSRLPRPRLAPHQPEDRRHGNFGDPMSPGLSR